MTHWAQEIWDRDFKETTGLVESLPDDLQEPIRRQLIKMSMRAATTTTSIAAELQLLAYLKCFLRVLPKD
mgnify:CR=1 FL=1